ECHYWAWHKAGSEAQHSTATGDPTAKNPLLLQEPESPAGDHRRIAAGASEDLEDHRRDGGFAARATYRAGAMGADEMREQLGAVHNGNVHLARDGDIGHRSFDCGREHERRRVRGDAAAILRHDVDAEAFKLGAEPGALAAIEGAIAAANASSHHHLELGERAHTGAAKPCVVKSA